MTGKLIKKESCTHPSPGEEVKRREFCDNPSPFGELVFRFPWQLPHVACRAEEESRRGGEGQCWDRDNGQHGRTRGRNVFPSSWFIFIIGIHRKSTSTRLLVPTKSFVSRRHDLRRDGTPAHHSTCATRWNINNSMNAYSCVTKPCKDKVKGNKRGAVNCGFE